MTPYTTNTGLQIGIAHMPRPQINPPAISGPHKSETRIERLGRVLLPYAITFGFGFLTGLLIFERVA